MATEEPRRRVAAVLLAAGTSTRLAGFKQLMSYRGRTFVEACVEALLASGADETLVVLGHRAEEVASAVARFQVRTVVNGDYLDGMASSVKAGVRAVPEGSAEGVMIALCDQPHVPPAVHRAVVEAYRRTGAAIVVPTVAGDTGHPVVFDLSLRDEILAVDPSEGLRAVTYAHRGDRLLVAVDSLSVIDDIDTPDDYARLSEEDHPRNDTK
jgi:molybdenum cofactor cytidylyltransferase